MLSSRLCGWPSAAGIPSIPRSAPRRCPATAAGSWSRPPRPGSGCSRLAARCHARRSACSRRERSRRATARPASRARAWLFLRATVFRPQQRVSAEGHHGELAVRHPLPLSPRRPQCSGGRFGRRQPKRLSHTQFVILSREDGEGSSNAMSSAPRRSFAVCATQDDVSAHVKRPRVHSGMVMQRGPPPRARQLMARRSGWRTSCPSTSPAPSGRGGDRPRRRCGSRASTAPRRCGRYAS